MLEDWYNYSAFGFTRRQMLWVLRNKDSFEHGEWPPEPPEYITDEYSKEEKKWVTVERAKSSNIDAPITKRRIKSGAYFENPAVIWAEVTVRLNKTGVDGKLLQAEVDAGYTIFSDEARSALNYISGMKRRGDYKRWLRNRRFKTKAS